MRCGRNARSWVSLAGVAYENVGGLELSGFILDDNVEFAVAEVLADQGVDLANDKAGFTTPCAGAGDGGGGC